MKNIDSDLIRGNIDTIILKTMLDGDKYGLDIIKEVESRSNGTYELKQPTLYSCLKRLENQQLISSYWLDSDIGGRRHYYKLTEKGHETLEKKQEEWAKSKFIIDNLLSNYNYDEYRLVKKDDYDKIIEGKQFVYEENNSPASIATEAQDSIENEIANDEFDSETNAAESDEDYEHVNDESDLNEFAEQDTSAEQERYHEAAEEQQVKNELDYNFGYNDNDIPAPETEDTDGDDNANYGMSFDDSQERINPLEPSSKRLYYVDIDDEENPSTNDEEYAETELEETSFEEQNFFEAEPEFDEEFADADLNENIENDDLEEESHTYVKFEDIEEETQTTAAAPEMEDQSSNEKNILNLLRQQDEEINTYYGDQKSYVNHLNKADEEDFEVVQSSMLDISNSALNEEVDESINEFETAIENLNNYNFAAADEESDAEETEEQFEEDEEPAPTVEFEPVQEPQSTVPNEFIDDFKQELSELNRNKNNGFFDSYDNPDYDVTNKKSTFVEEPADFDFAQTDSSDASFEEFEEDKYDSQENEFFNFTFANQGSKEEMHEEVHETYPVSYDDRLYDLDKIITNNATSYSNQYTNMENDAFTSFVPKYTGENYKQKLSNLSAYSKVTDDEVCEKPVNEDALNKAKDIETLKSEFEQEGIKIREFKKYGAAEQSEKTYLLSNKIKFINSLILLFCYVFILSAVYIILNNTSFKDSYGFSFKYFLFGFIPFGVYALYHMIMFLIDPYKKTPAKLAPRILIFISLIITVQLLLITYCVNLQLGFYSFTQEQYNHLLWIIPLIVSFAPIICNVSYITLFYSKNFNV